MNTSRFFKITFIVFILVQSIALLVLAYTPTAVFGQADYTTGEANRGADATADSFSFPLGISLDADGGFYVADRENHRVLYFANDGDSIADKVYGQFGDFNAHISNNNGNGNSGRASADSLSMPTAVGVDSQGGLYITDRDNHRVLYFANDSDTTADRVYGQYGNFNTNMTNNDSTINYGEPGADNLGTYILGLVVDKQDGIYVSDSSNHRVLYYANDGDTTADKVYGQWDDFTYGQRNNDGTGHRGEPSANSLNFPRGLVMDANNGLYIADRDNNRILYFADDGDTTADKVYGQFGDFTTNIESNDGNGAVGTPSADNFSHPKAVGIGPAGGLYVADTLHHRVVWFANDGDTIADGVAGQAMDMTAGLANNDGSGASGAPSIDGLNGPQGIVVSPDGTIYLSDTGNNRVLIINCPDWS